MWNRVARVLAFIFLLSPCAQAQVTPLIFERETVHIDSPKSEHAPLNFDVEVRPEDALRLEYIHTLNALTDTTGVMIAFTAPSVIGLPSLKVMTPVDALFITADGTISQILPNVVLADMAQEIVAKAPVKAFLFLKAGTVAAVGIHPQDVVVGRKFIPAPPMMR